MRIPFEEEYLTVPGQSSCVFCSTILSVVPYICGILRPEPYDEQKKALILDYNSLLPEGAAPVVIAYATTHHYHERKKENSSCHGSSAAQSPRSRKSYPVAIIAYFRAGMSQKGCCRVARASELLDEP